MDFSMNQNSIDYYKKLGVKSARNEYTAEAVVPDTQGDIDRILGATANVCVHTKNALTGRVSLTGDVAVKAAYVPEGEKGVCSVEFKIPFSVDFDVESQGEVLPVVSVRLVSLDVRMLNPRKVLARAELAADGECYCKESMCWYDAVEENNGIFIKKASKSISLPAFVTEKSFNISDEISIPEGKNEPERMLFASSSLNIDDWSDVGGRLIVRGTAATNVMYMPAGGDVPECAEFSTQFSQLLELPEISMTDFQVTAMLTDVYTDVFTTAGGAKAISIEIHGVAQCVCQREIDVSYIDDAYSTKGMLDISRTANSAACGASTKIPAVCRERLELRREAAKIISVQGICGAAAAANGMLQAPVTLTVIYIADDNSLCSDQIKIMAEAEYGGASPEWVTAGMGTAEATADGSSINTVVNVCFAVNCCNTAEFNPVTGISLEDENVYSDARPSVTIVRADTDDMWSIAKRYRACADAISKCNCLEDGECVSGKILLIPRA